MPSTRSVLFGGIALISVVMLSLHVGLRVYVPTQVWSALVSPDGGQDALIIRSLRVPRTIAAMGVGAALGVCGVLMQSVLRNPLADPGLLGVNAGAGFAIVFGFGILGITSFAALSGLALLGAAATTLALFGLLALSRGRLTPVTLVLAGVTLAALLASLTQVLIVIDEATMEALLFWLAGGFADRPSQTLWAGLPVLAIAICSSAFLANALDTLQAGEQAAAAMGVNLRLVQILALSLATLLAAVSVTLAGPVGFVGLVAPHLAHLGGAREHRQRISWAALIGAVLTIVADIAARLVVAPQEAPVTALLALVGAPVLVGMVRRQSRRVA